MRLLMISMVAVALLTGATTALPAAEFAVGADLSYLKQAEEAGMVFKDGTNAMAGLNIFRNHGYNWIRLRIFVEPVTGGLANDLAYTLAQAKAAKQLGYKFLLDLHFANSWADPGHQPAPAAWSDLTHKQRTKKLFEYTRDTLAAFGDAGALPEMVQVGNEITHGILWPDGKLPEHWDNFAHYIKAAIKGVEAGSGTNTRPRIMMHIDQGASIAATKNFFDHLEACHIHYDVIGFSYYPWWHGTLLDLRENLAFTANRYHKDMIIVETAYNWRSAKESSSRPGPFPETPEGQREFLDELIRIALGTPDGRCKGIFWWEPAVGTGAGRISRSFFDEQGNSLPVLTVFDKYTRPAPRTRH